MTRMQPTPFPSPARRSRVTTFATVAAVVVVAVAVIGGAALLLNPRTGTPSVGGPVASATPSPTPSPSPRSDEALLADLAAVWTGPYDAARVAAVFAPEAVIHDLAGGVTLTGLDQIGARIRYLDAGDFQAVVTSAPIRQGDFIAWFDRHGGYGEPAIYPGLVVIELKDGKVLTQWIYGAPLDWRPPAAGAPTPTPAPAGWSDEALVADLAAAASSPYDAAKVAALWAPDAVIHEVTDANLTQTGLEAIQARFKEMAAAGFTVAVTSAPIRQDDFVAVFGAWGNAAGDSYRGLVVYELRGGKVQNQWVYQQH